MGSYAQSTQSTYDLENNQCVDPNMTSTSSSSSQENSKAIDKLTGNQGPTQGPQLNLNAKSGAEFSSLATTALNAVVPGPGSFASLKIAGLLPIYTTGAMTAFLEPVLELQAAHTNEGKYEVTLNSMLGIRAKAGTDGGGWWPKFLAYFKGYVKGSLKIVGDSGAEIINELMLTIRTIVEGACDSAGAPDDIKEMLAGAVMSSAAKAETIREMSGKDSVTVGVGGGFEGGVDTSFGGTKGGAEVMFSKTISDQDDDDRLEVTSATTLTLAGEAEFKDLGFKLNGNVTFVWKQGQLDEWFVGISATQSMSLGKFSDIALIGTSWAADFTNAMANLIKNAASKSSQLNNSAEIIDLIGGISVSDNALKYSVLGNQLKSAAASPSFAGKSGQKVSLMFSAQGGWSSDAGANVKLALATADVWELGEEGSTPLYIEAKTGDTIVSFDGSSKGGASFGS